MTTLCGVVLNINAEKAFVIFPNDVTLKKQEELLMGQTFGELEESMSKGCQLYADGKIAREELVNSLVMYLKHASN